MTELFWRRLDGFDDFLVGGEAAEAGFDATVGDVFLYLGEEVVGDFGCWSVIGFECGGRHIFGLSRPASLYLKKSDSKTEAIT